MAGANGTRGMQAFLGDLGGFSSVARREGMGPREIEAVLAWKARTRCGWQAAAAYAGRDVHTVRMACDPDYRAARPAVRGGRAVSEAAAGEAEDLDRPMSGRQARADRDGVRAGPTRTRRSSAEVRARRAAVMRALGERRLTSDEVIAITGFALIDVRNDLSALGQQGWVGGKPSGEGTRKVFFVTAAGRLALERGEGA